MNNSTERNNRHRERTADHHALYARLPSATWSQLLELVHRAGPLATVRSTLIDLIEKAAP
jgi:hypothetical protein